MEGVKGSPCFLGNPSDAPWGANLCDTNVSVCLEKWAGPNAGEGSRDQAPSQVVPQIDPSVKLYNHGEGPYYLPWGQHLFSIVSKM